MHDQTTEDGERIITTTEPTMSHPAYPADWTRRPVLRGSTAYDEYGGWRQAIIDRGNLLAVEVAMDALERTLSTARDGTLHPDVAYVCESVTEHLNGWRQDEIAPALKVAEDSCNG